MKFTFVLVGFAAALTMLSGQNSAQPKSSPQYGRCPPVPDDPTTPRSVVPVQDGRRIEFDVVSDADPVPNQLLYRYLRVVQNHAATDLPFVWSQAAMPGDWKASARGLAPTIQCISVAVGPTSMPTKFVYGLGNRSADVVLYVPNLHGFVPAKGTPPITSAARMGLFVGDRVVAIGVTLQSSVEQRAEMWHYEYEVGFVTDSAVDVRWFPAESAEVKLNVITLAPDKDPVRFGFASKFSPTIVPGVATFLDKNKETGILAAPAYRPLLPPTADPR